MYGFLVLGLESRPELAHDFPGVPWWAYIVAPVVAIAVGLPLWNAIAPAEIKDEMRQLKRYQQRDLYEIKDVHNRQKYLIKQKKIAYKRARRAFKRKEGVHRWEPLHRRRT